MRNYLKAVAGFLFPVILFSCNDEEKDIREKGYSLFCWPSKTACDNREYGIEFSYRAIVITAGTGSPQVSSPRIATMVCCRYVEDLIDSLTAFNDSLKTHRDQNSGDFSRRCRIGPDIEVYGSYSFSWQGFKPFTFSTLGFKDMANPYGFDLSVPQFEYFDAFRDEVMAMYRKCCLREEDN
jgi:hypothetical protein